MQVNQSLPPELIRIVISVVVVVGFTFLNVLLLGYAERKISARIMRRPGPMEVGPQGILQLLVDGVKLVAKQFIVPSEAGTLFRIAPLLAFTRDDHAGLRRPHPASRSASTRNHGSAKHGLGRFWWTSDLVQTKGRAVLLYRSMKASMCSMSSLTLVNDAPLSDCPVRIENQISI